MKPWVATALVSLTVHLREQMHAASAATPKEVEQRIERVINGLLPDTALDEHYAPKASLKQRMAFYHTPGVSIAVINDHRVEWARGFGVKEFGKRAPVTKTTLFQAGSISKPIFALGVMRLVQEGTLNLAEDVNHCLTFWKVPPQESWQPRITLRQLLSHTAGFTVHGAGAYESSDKLPTLVDAIEGRSQAQTAAIEVNILPETQFRYSGGALPSRSW
jgi:CubicO group peptidase (beta-lactamase class C family)